MAIKFDNIEAESLLNRQGELTITLTDDQGITVAGAMNSASVTATGTVQGSYVTANNTSGAANGSAQEVARFVNTTSGATSGYIYIGAASGTDWRLGKNILGTASDTNFGITKHSGTDIFLEIDGSGNTSILGDVFSDGLYVNSTSAVSGTQVAIVQDGNQNLQRWGSSSDGTTQASYRFRIDQNFKFIGNSGGGDTLTLDSTNGSATFTGSISASNFSGSSSGTNTGDQDLSSYLTTVAFSDLTGKPSTLSGYGINDGASLGLDQVFTGDTEFEGDLLRTNQRISNNQEYPLGHYTPGETVFELDPTWSNRELRQYFGNTNVSWDGVANAPGGYAVYIDGSVSVGGVYGSGFPYIPIDQDGIYYMECWIKNAGTAQGHYMGSMDYEADFTHPSSGGGNPGSYGYFVMSNYTSAAEWTKVSGYITGHHNSNSGAFETDATYWTPQALFNYSAGTGTRACWISGWKVIRVDHVGDRTFQDDVKVKGKLEVHTLDTNTASTTALVMNGNEVEKRTLGSNAFNSTSFLTSVDFTDIGGTVSSTGGATRTNYNLGFKPPTGSYAGFRFYGTDGQNAGYFLVRGTSDNGVYGAEGITLVGDQGWLTLAHRYSTNKGIRFMTGDTAASTRMTIASDGDININNSLTVGTDLTVSGNIKDVDYKHAGSDLWLTKKYVRSVGITGGEIANSWVQLSRVSIASSYGKLAAKFTIHGYDDVSSGTEVIDVIYENGNSAQENHGCQWYSTDNNANLFKAVRSIRSSSSGTSNTYDLYVQMAGDWRDSFTVVAEYWRTGTNQSITFITSAGSANEPSAGSDDIELGERRWYTQNSYMYLGGSNRVYTTGDFTNNSSNWDTAYTDRNKWDGGSTGLTASTGRASLGLGTAATAAATAFATSGHNHAGVYALEYELMQSDNSDSDMHVWRKNHAMLSDGSSIGTYIIVQTNVPQDNASMGGFTLVYQDDYNSSGEGGEIKIYGYWNAESNGGFIDFRYECSNPYHTPTIEVCRNSTSGDTAFFISGEGGNYTQLIAKDLWLGYAASSATVQWGDGWTITQADGKNGYTNFDTLNRNDFAAITTNGATPSLTGGVTAAEIRTLIGAGTGNGSSDLVIGTTATTAMAGNTAFASTAQGTKADNAAPKDYESIADLGNPNAITGSWNTGSTTDWGTPRIGSSTARWTDGTGYIQFNIPDGMKSAYLSQLTWSSGGYFYIYGIQSDGGAVLLRVVNSRNAVETTNEGNPNQHDGSTTVFAGTGLDNYSAIRITNKSGRLHLTGLGFTSSTVQGSEGVGLVHPSQLSTALSYNSLINLPTLGTAAATASTDYATSTQGTTADAALPKAGGTMTGTMKVTGSIIYENDADSGYIPFPKGGQYQTRTGSHTGAIKITLPTHGGDDMLKWVVDIYDYSTGESVTMFMGGYLYQATGGNEWVSCTVTTLTEHSSKDYTVRFGADGTNSCVWIGETNSTWSYPQVVVRDFVAGFISDIDAYDDNWSISFVTSFDTVDEVISDNLPTADWDRIEGKPSTFPPNIGTTATTALAGNTSLFDGAYSSLSSIPSTFAPSAHNHDDRYYTETESDTKFTRKYTFNPGSANQGRRYIRLFTLDNFDDGLSGILSAAGDYGDADKAMYHIQIGTRTSLSFDVYQTSDAAVSDDYNFYYRQIANDDYEIWALMSDYNQNNNFTVLSQFGTVTYNFDSVSTEDPGDLNQITKYTMYHSGNLTPLTIGTTSTTAMAGNTSLFDGAYSSLSGKPTLGTAAAAATTDFATAAQGTLADSALQSLPSHNHDDRYFRRYKGQASSISSTAYRTAFTVAGGNLASSIRFSVQGTTGSVVVSNVIDVIANHYQDILIEATSGVYTRLYVKVISNNNEDFAVELKTDSANAVTLDIEVLAYGNETVTFTTSHSFTGTSLELDCEPGKTFKATGGDSGDIKTYGVFKGDGSGLTGNIKAATLSDQASPTADIQIGAGTSSTGNRSDVALLGAANAGGVVNALGLLNTATAANSNGVALNFHNANNYSPTGQILLQQNSSGTTTHSAMKFFTYGSNNLTHQMSIKSDGVVRFLSYGTGILSTDTNGNISAISDGTSGQVLTTNGSGGFSFTTVTSGSSYTLPTASESVLGGIKVGDNLTITEGVLSATDTDTVYVHPTSAGNKHIPTGGAAGQFLKYSASGTATWATPSYTTNTNTTYSAGNGLDLTSTTFSVEPDLRDGITHVGKDANNYIQFDSTNGRIDFYAGGVFVARMESDGDLHMKGDVIAFSNIFG